MSFAINTYDLPAIHDYAHAKRLYESIVPIRGNPHDIRPLGKRSKQHMRIAKAGKRNGNGAEGYSAVLYKTPRVTWYADGTILLDSGGYASPSTAKFIRRVCSPVYSVNAVYNHTALLVRMAQGEFLLDTRLWLDERGNPVDPPPCVVHAIDRKAMNAVRKQYRPFLTYLHSVGKLMDYMPPAEDMQHYLSERGMVDLMRSSDTDDMAKAYAMITKATARRRWGWYGGTWEARTCNSAAAVNAEVQRLLLEEHAGEVLKREVLPYGQFKADKYRRYSHHVEG